MAGSVFRRQVSSGSIFGSQIDQAVPEQKTTNCSGRLGTIGACAAEKTIVVAGALFISIGGLGVGGQGRFTDVAGQAGTRGQAFHSVGGGGVSTTTSGQVGTLGEVLYSTSQTKQTFGSGQSGTLGQSFYSRETNLSTSASGQSGIQGNASASKAIEYGAGEGMAGVLGSSVVFRSGSLTLTPVDVEMIADMVIEYDAQGEPVTLRYALQAVLAILNSQSEGFPGPGIKTFKSLDGQKDRVKGSSDAVGNRESNPEFDFTDV